MYILFISYAYAIALNLSLTLHSFIIQSTDRLRLRAAYNIIYITYACLTLHPGITTPPMRS